MKKEASGVNSFNDLTGNQVTTFCIFHTVKGTNFRTPKWGIAQCSPYMPVHHWFGPIHFVGPIYRSPY